MTIVAAPASNEHKQDLLNDTSLRNLASNGELEVAGRLYGTADRVAALFKVTTRTLSRWNARRIGPPRIKIGKTVLYELAKLPEWLERLETEPVRPSFRRR
jgi:hypothetical protein